MGVGVVVGGHIARNNCDPHPARLRFASAVDPPHKGEGRLGREPSCKAWAKRPRIALRSMRATAYTGYGL